MTDPSDQPTPESAPEPATDQVAAQLAAAYAEANDPSKLLAEHERLKAANQGLLRDLAAQGAQVDPMAVFQTRLELLMEALAPDGSPERLQLEIVFEQRIHDMVSRAKTEVARAKLTAPSGTSQRLQDIFGAPPNGNGRRR